MEFLHAAIALLASMVLVLAGMVGWLYWHQQRLIHSQTNITLAIGEIARAITEPKTIEAPAPESIPEEVKLPEPEGEVDAPTATDEAEEDDRVSVEEEQGPQVVDTVFDTDALETKTKKELQDILTKRGIPFGKNDTKGVLISLLKATA
jgi:hypothetical protein